MRLGTDLFHRPVDFVFATALFQPRVLRVVPSLPIAPIIHRYVSILRNHRRFVAERSRFFEIRRRSFARDRSRLSQPTRFDDGVDEPGSVR